MDYRADNPDDRTCMKCAHYKDCCALARKAAAAGNDDFDAHPCLRWAEVREN